MVLHACASSPKALVRSPRLRASGSALSGFSVRGKAALCQKGAMASYGGPYTCSGLGSITQDFRTCKTMLVLLVLFSSMKPSLITITSVSQTNSLISIMI